VRFVTSLGKLDTKGLQVGGHAGQVVADFARRNAKNGVKDSSVVGLYAT